MFCLVLMLLSLQVSYASDEEKEAERVRISDDMERFSKRSNWEAVNKKYQEILELGVEVPFADHMLGAQATFNLGHIQRNPP